ncbi:MAG: cysteine hydrolase family protein [Thermomicrobiales bacterium]
MTTTLDEATRTSAAHSHNPFNSILAAPPPLAVTAANTALLVVDMQYFDAHPDWGEGRTAKELGVASCFDPYFAQIDDVIPRIQRLLALFRDKEMEVIHLRVAELTKDSRDVGWKQLVRGLIVPSDSREADPLDELAPIDDELIVSKSSSGVFPVTNLDRLLRNMGTTTLVMTGTSTGGCVESAVRDAVDLGYDVIVVSDACADSTPESHAHALGRMAGGLTRIKTAEEVGELIGTVLDGSRHERGGLQRVKPYLPTASDEPPPVDANPYDLIFGPAVRLPLARDNTALLLVDAQRLTCDPEAGLGRMARERGRFADFEPYYERVDRALAGMAHLLQVCREAGLPVIHVRTAGRLPDGRDLSRKTRGQGISVGRESPEAALMPAVSPRPDEIVLEKPGSGAFTGSGLDELLRNLGIEHVIVGGVSYDGAVESTIRSATDRGYGLVLAPDACATFDEARQAGLWEMESGIIQVKPVAEIVAQVQAMPATREGGGMG